MVKAFYRVYHGMMLQHEMKKIIWHTLVTFKPLHLAISNKVEVVPIAIRETLISI